MNLCLAVGNPCAQVGGPVVFSCFITACREPRRLASEKRSAGNALFQKGVSKCFFNCQPPCRGSHLMLKLKLSHLSDHLMTTVLSPQTA